MKFKQWVFASVFISSVGAIVWFLSQPYSLSSARWIAASYYAKELCSCFYLVRQDQDFCMKRTRQFIPFKSVTRVSERREWAVQAFGKIAKARFVDERTGCRLVREAEAR